MNELLYDILSATGYKVFPLRAPKNHDYPFVIYAPITDTFENCASGVTDLLEIQYQIDVYSNSYEECKAIMYALIDSLQTAELFKVSLYDILDEMDDNGNIYRSRLSLKLWSN